MKNCRLIFLLLSQTLNPLFTIPKCEFQYTKSELGDKRFAFCMHLDTVLYWSPLLHLQMTHFYRKLAQLRQNIVGSPGKQTGSLKLTLSLFDFIDHTIFSSITCKRSWEEYRVS
jgi:hypothetical protein